MIDRPLIVAVWKEKLDLQESIDFTIAFLPELGDASEWPFDMALAPSFLAFVEVRDRVRPAGIKLCAQNVMWNIDSGSYIGETTARMLRAVHSDYAIVGHSERRLFFAETDEMIAKKADAAIEFGITPIVCVGDTAEQKDAGETEAVLRRQLHAFFDRSPVTPDQFLIAYEPVWAISTWRSEWPLPTGKEVQRLHEHVRRAIADIQGSSFADKVRLLYGGSVNGDNAKDYFAQPDVDGALVGGASKRADTFLQTLRSARDGFAVRTGSL